LILGSIIYRIIRGKLIFIDRQAGEVLFKERGISGRSPSHFGQARGSLIVTVTRNQLRIRPFFPFNLMFVPELLGLEQNIPLESITELDVKQNFWKLNQTTVTFLNSKGYAQKFELYLSDFENSRMLLKQPPSLEFDSLRQWCITIALTVKKRLTVESMLLNAVNVRVFIIKNAFRC
jgi:hypothetical protein